MSIPIGEVISVMGIEVAVKAFENSNLETHFHRGKRYKGISIREYIAIEHGFREIVCTVEGEYLDERIYETEGANKTFTRKLKVKPIGYFEDGVFKDGIKFLPKIGDVARLLSERQVSSIFERDTVNNYVIGKLLKEDLAVSLQWVRLFNSHLGIFGNTGSGKSNTLTKLYTVLFDNKADAIGNHSKFVFLDFNGEYTGNQLAGEEYKKVIRLKTRTNDGDKFILLEDEFWDAETLGILFQATVNTQRPFLHRVISGRKRYAMNYSSLDDYLCSTFRDVLTSTDPKPEALELLKTLARNISVSPELIVSLGKVSRKGGKDNNCFHIVRGPKDWVFLSEEKFKSDYNEYFEDKLKKIDLSKVSGFKELLIRSALQLIRDVLSGSAQYEHINPLLRRVEALKSDFTKVLSVVDNVDAAQKMVTVVSFRECTQDVKKILPILIAKHHYEQHKATVSLPPKTTLHLVIDEAHNILSQQSSRESESWKDYRLELFEEIVKEGRKFGVFITLASQRPADISSTIVSQLHNYFIHRLVNDRDLALLENTISTLDSVSRSQIPTLPQGACVVTGTTFDIPMLMQIDKLPPKCAPDSGDVQLDQIWR